MQIIKNNFIPRREWINLLRSSSLSTPFQSPEYYDLVNTVPDLSADVHAIEHKGELLALCVTTIQKEAGIKSFFSRRGIIYGGPVIKNDSHAALDILLKAVNNDLRSRVIYTETRNSNSYESYREVFRSNGWLYQPELNFHLDCSTKETAWNNFNSTRKRQIKKALKSGVSISPANDLKEVREYYLLLQELYKTKVKKPLAPLQFFEQLYKTDMTKFLLVKLNDRIIGGIVAPLLENKTIYELNICGQDHQFKEAYPSVMATFAAIEYGYSNGFKMMDFMGAGSPDDDYGVREFKSKFGGSEVENGRFLRVFNPLLYNIGKMAVSKLKWLVH